MATQPRRIVLTYEDYAALPDDRNRYELFEGELQVSPSPGARHQDVVLGLGALLRQHVRQHGLGRVFVAPLDVLLSNITVVQPDVLFVSTVRLALVEEPFVRGAPDLVVEVISPTSGRADRGVKQQLYARHGVAHYWLIDPEQRQATAFRLAEGAYEQVASAGGRERFSAPPFADLAIDLAELWD
jgi:Uma2 family endonuclease